MVSDNVRHVGVADFDAEVLAPGPPVLVDFWAPWCGPCLAVAPLLEELAEELAGRVRVVKVNIDDNQGLAGRYQISSIPSFILFKEGHVADRMLGALPKAAFRDFLERNL